MKSKKKLYTGEIRNLTIKSIDPNTSALKKIAYESTVVRNDALFYKNFAGAIISVDYDTKLLSRDEAEYFLECCVETAPSRAMQASCLYQGTDFKFSHEVTNEELKKLIKTKKIERKIKKQGN